MNCARGFASLCLLAATVALLAASGARASDDPVNYDDPNMAVTNEFAGDTVASCPADMSDADRAQCFRDKGLSAPQGVALIPTMQRAPDR